MCTAYEAIVKEFQTNLASFVNVNCITFIPQFFFTGKVFMFSFRRLNFSVFAPRIWRKSWEMSIQIKRSSRNPSQRWSTGDRTCSYLPKDSSLTPKHNFLRVSTKNTHSQRRVQYEWRWEIFTRKFCSSSITWHILTLTILVRNLRCRQVTRLRQLQSALSKDFAHYSSSNNTEDGQKLPQRSLMKPMLIQIVAGRCRQTSLRLSRDSFQWLISKQANKVNLRYLNRQRWTQTASLKRFSFCRFDQHLRDRHQCTVLNKPPIYLSNSISEINRNHSDNDSQEVNSTRFLFFQELVWDDISRLPKISVEKVTNFKCCALFKLSIILCT